MKKIIAILLIILLCGCKNKASEYKEVSDIAVSLFQNRGYDKTELNNEQINLIENYREKLINPEINVSDFIIYNEDYITKEQNTPGIYIKDHKCYILYNDIEFTDASDHNTEPMANLVCNGYNVILFQDSVKPIDIDYQDPKYDYRYLGYYKSNGYHYAYRSYYDGSGLVVTINDNIETEFREVESLDLKTISNNSITKYIIPVIVMTALIGISIYLKKKEKTN